jgi:hypothetical protein
VAVLNCIYEEEFLGFSYGFPPKRGQHDALDALVVGITTRQVNVVFALCVLDGAAMRRAHAVLGPS